MEKPIAEIIAKLNKPIPNYLIKTLKAKGSPKYLAQADVKAMLNRACPGWRGEIMDQGINTVEGVRVRGEREEPYKTTSVWVRYRITIPCAEGEVYREAFGIEDGSDPDMLYGNPWANAEANAFKRCAAWFGLGLHDLYNAQVPRAAYGDQAAPEEVETEEEPTIWGDPDKPQLRISDQWVAPFFEKIYEGTGGAESPYKENPEDSYALMQKVLVRGKWNHDINDNNVRQAVSFLIQNAHLLEEINDSERELEDVA